MAALDMPTDNVASYTDLELLAKASKALPLTQFERVVPSELPGFKRVQLKSGQFGYLSKDGHYLIFGLALDLEQKRALDGAMNGKIGGNE